MVKTKENPTATEKGAEEVKKVNAEKKVAGSENAEIIAEPEVVNEASEKSDEPMAAARDEAANGVENEKTPGEKSEKKKDQNEKKKKKKHKKKKNQTPKKTEDNKPEASKAAKPEASNRAKDDIAGLIFMCSSKTKQDCFRYHVFGLPKGLKDSVKKLSKGMKLFLYDYELRLMYGIYKAKGPGGLNIEPNAFRTAERPFPAQVRFSIQRDCLPLPEDEFKVAIKDNYYGKNKRKFKFELKGRQVRDLCRLFKPIREDRRPSRFENVQNFSRPNLSMPAIELTPRSHLARPAREIASLYPLPSEDPYVLQATDPYRYAYPRQPIPLYEPIGVAAQRELGYGRILEESTYLDRLQRGRILEDPAFLNGTTRGYVPRELDYGDVYLRRDPVRRSDVYPYASGSSSLYRY